LLLDISGWTIARHIFMLVLFALEQKIEQALIKIYESLAIF